jgi:SAM-dependent methyltransferase
MSAVSAFSPTFESLGEIRTRPCPDCYVCHKRGELLYENLTDRLFAATGRWNVKKCPDSACGFLWLDPMPLAEDLGLAYRAYYTHEDHNSSSNSLARRIYSRIQIGYLRTKYHYSPTPAPADQILALLAYLNPLRRASFDFSVFFLEAKPLGCLLDLGCGDGSMLSTLKEFGWQAEGVDFDPAARELASRKGLTVHLGTLADQNFPDESFDAITASHFVEHIPDPLATFKECRRILKPGGQLILITPNAASWGHRLYRADWRGLEPPRHLGIFTPASLTTLIRRAGLNSLYCRTFVRNSGILRASSMLKHTGTVDSALPPNWFERIWEESRGLFQWAGSLTDPTAGEEVLSISSK